MFISSSKYREIYPQSNFKFDFTVSDYSSRHFEIGLSGNSYVYFSFKSGLIRDYFGNLLGTFNGEPITIESKVKDGWMNYSLNSVPMLRYGFIGGTSIFSSIAAKILDSNSHINLDSYLYGETVPQLNFSNFYSTTGVSGKIMQQGLYAVKVFGVSSPELTGSWQFPSTLLQGVHYNFYNNDVSGLEVGTNISLNLETNFGNKSYSLKVQTLGAGGSAEEEVDDPNEQFDNQYVGLYQINGDIDPKVSWERVYSIDFNVGPSYSLDLTFDYVEGKNYNTLVEGNYVTTITYSGELPAVNGYCDGTLYCNQITVNQEVVLDEMNRKMVPMSPVTKSRAFTNLSATGIATINSNLEGWNVSLNDTVVSVIDNCAVDLGGKIGTFPSPLIPADYSYRTIFNYNGVDIYNGEEFRTFSGIVDERDDGRKDWETIYTEITGAIFLTEDLSYSSPVVNNNSDYVDLSPYRGIAFASLEDNMLLKGDTETSQIPWKFLSKNNPTLLFTHLPNIDYNGYTGLLAGTEISGRVISESYNYKFAGSDINVTSSEFVNGKNIGNLMVSQSINFFRNLSPFQNFTGTSDSLIIQSTNGTETEYTQALDWNANSFISLKSDVNAEKNQFLYRSAFRSEGVPHVCLSFDHPAFLYSPYHNNIVRQADSEVTNLFPSLAMARKTDTVFGTENITVGSDGEDSFHSLSVKEPNKKASIKFAFIPQLNQVNDLDGTNFENDTFSISVKRPASGPVQYVQLSLSDEIYATRTNQASSYVEKSQYVNFDLLNGDYTAYECSASITSETGDWYRISILFKASIGKKISFVNLSFVESQDSDRLAAPVDLSTISNLHVKRYQLELAQNGTTPTAFNNVQSSSNLMHFEAIFSYFLHKIYGEGGNFRRINNYTVFVPDRGVEAIKLSDGVFKPVHTINGFRINEDNIAKKIKSFVAVLTGGVDPGGDPSLNLYYTYIPSLVHASKRENNNFSLFSVATDFNSLFAEDINGEYITYDASHPTHGEAVAEILSVIKANYAEFTKDNFLENGRIVELPYQMYGNKIEALTEEELAGVYFRGTLQKDKSLYIPAGYGRFYPNSTNSSSYGFYYETPEFYSIKNNSINGSEYANIFPNSPHLLNSLASLRIPRSDLIFYSLKRLIRPSGIVEINKAINQSVYLTSSYFSVTVTEEVALTGVYENATRNASDVWRLTVSDSLDGSLNPISFPSPGSDFEIYTLGGIGIADNTNRSKYLKVEYTQPTYTSLNVKDVGKISLNVNSVDGSVFAVTQTIP